MNYKQKKNYEQTIIQIFAYKYQNKNNTVENILECFG